MKAGDSVASDLEWLYPDLEIGLVKSDKWNSKSVIVLHE